MSRELKHIALAIIVMIAGSELSNAMTIPSYNEWTMVGTVALATLLLITA